MRKEKITWQKEKSCERRNALWVGGQGLPRGGAWTPGEQAEKGGNEVRASSTSM